MGTATRKGIDTIRFEKLKLNALGSNWYTRTYLWRNVVGCAAEGLCGRFAEHAIFAHAEVGQFQVPT